MINYTRRRTDDDDPFETIIGHGGKRVRILKDGRSVHVRFRDAQAARGQAYLPRDGRQPLTDQQRRDLQGCRPGFRTLDSAQLRPGQRRHRTGVCGIRSRNFATLATRLSGRVKGTSYGRTATPQIDNR